MIATGATPKTVTLRGGDVVLAKMHSGEPAAVTYANRTQAERAQERLGEGWEVIRRGRPWFVRKAPAHATEQLARYNELMVPAESADGLDVHRDRGL